jgi:hypothetical protein
VVLIHADAEGGAILFGKVISPLSGNISISPPQKDFGSVMMGGSSDTQVFTITNTGPGNLTILSAYGIGDLAPFSPSLPVTNPCSSWPQTLSPGEGCNLAATFVPPSVGTLKATFVINSTAINTPVFNLPLSGTGVTPYSLTVTISGSGAVNNTKQPPVFTCSSPSSSCSNSFGAGSQFTLHATPSANYSFAGWSGGTGSVAACSGNGDCSFALAAPTTVTASFDPDPLVKVIPSHPNTIYQTLQGAYDAAQNNDQLKARNIVFSDTSLNLNKGTAVTLKGGLEADFSTVKGCTSLQGVLTLSTGRLTVENLCIK